MTYRHSLLLLLTIFIFPAYGYGQQWSGIIGPGRASDWSTAGVEGGIPSANWPNCATAACNTLFGGSVTPSTIANAIASAPIGSVVRIPAGSFTLASGFTVNRGVVVRGAGANRTFLDINGQAPSSCGYFYAAAISLCASSSVPYTSANWTGGYAKGTTRISVSSTSGIAVGSVIQLEQLDDAGDGWPATGDLYLCSTTGSCSREGGGYDLGWAGRANAQFVKVTAIVGGGQVDISPPIAFPNFRSGQSPGAHWPSSANLTLTFAGVEDLSVDQTGVGQVGFLISNTLNCWVKGVRSVYNSGSGSFINHYEIISSMRLTIRDNYLYGPTSVANTSYPVSPDNVGSMLFENNILHGVSGDVVMNGPVSNSVFSYNFFPGVNGPGIILHGAGESLNLTEGNVMMGFWEDVTHGRSAFQTIFRNAMIGNRYNAGGTAQINQPIHLQTGSRFANVVGNVMGDASQFGTYQTLQADSGSSIYVLGWQGNASGGGSPANDPHVARTLLRWGNWDSVTSANDNAVNDLTGIRFVASEVPSAIANFPNPVPSTQVLPASLYYSARPSWWPSGKAWPPIGPDVSGGNITNMGGHANTNPAADCYLNVMRGPANGSGGPLSFDPTACYGSSSGGSAPASPTNLRIVP